MIALMLSRAVFASEPVDEPKRCVVEVHDTQPPVVRSRACAALPDPLPAVDGDDLRPRLGSWPHPTVITVDGHTVRRYRISPSGAAKPIPVSRVRVVVEPVLPKPVAASSCEVDVDVDAAGVVQRATARSCLVPVEVEQAATAWRFRPYTWDGQATPFSARILVRWASPPPSDEPADAIETFSGR